MTINLKTKSCCVTDFGLFMELARTLSRLFGKVFYHYYYKNPFPTSNPSLVGTGFPEIEVVEDLRDTLKECDLYVFPDTYLPDVQEGLLADGKLVFGSRDGDELELFRHDAKQHMEDLGIPVGEYELVKGMDALRQYLKEHNDQFVKCSYHRGDFETFEAPSYKYIESKLDSIEQGLGVKKYWQEFIVEKAIPDAVEIGYDGFCIDGQFPPQSLTGIETKSKGYVGQMLAYEKNPAQIREFNEKISGTLKKYSYRNFFSTEIRINKKKEWFILDPCMRAGNPPLFTELEFYDNLAEIIWEGAQGRVVKPTSKYKWAAQLQLMSDWADTNQVMVEFPEKIRPNIKLINGMKYQGNYYIIPQVYKMTSIGAVVAYGQSMNEAIENCKKLAEQVKGYFVECDPSALDKAEDEWNKLKAITS